MPRPAQRRQVPRGAGRARPSRPRGRGRDSGQRDGTVDRGVGEVAGRAGAGAMARPRVTGLTSVNLRIQVPSTVSGCSESGRACSNSRCSRWGARSPEQGRRRRGSGRSDSSECAPRSRPGSRTRRRSAATYRNLAHRWTDKDQKVLLHACAGDLPQLADVILGQPVRTIRGELRHGSRTTGSTKTHLRPRPDLQRRSYAGLDI